MQALFCPVTDAEADWEQCSGIPYTAKPAVAWLKKSACMREHEQVRGENRNWLGSEEEKSQLEKE